MSLKRTIQWRIVCSKRMTLKIMFDLDLDISANDLDPNKRISSQEETSGIVLPSPKYLAI